jgi:hypothetical protein
MKQTILFIFTLFCLAFLTTSCGTLPEDSSPAPIDYGHYTLEMHFEGSFDQGLLGTVINFDEPTDKQLEIPVFGKGEISITSKRCVFSETKNFSKKDKVISYSIEKLIKNVPSEEFACIFNIFLFVDGLDRGMQGQFYVLKDEGYTPLWFKILDKEYDTVWWYQFSDATNFNIDIEFDNPAGTMIISGCGVNKEFRVEKNTKIKLSEILVSKESCLVTFGIETDTKEVFIAELNLKVFDKSVLEIPDPQIRFSRGSLRIRSEMPIGIVGIDRKIKRGRYVRDNVGDKEVSVRLVSANGRYKLLRVKKGEITWKASIKY